MGRADLVFVVAGETHRAPGYRADPVVSVLAGLAAPTWGASRVGQFRHVGVLAHRRVRPATPESTFGDQSVSGTCPRSFLRPLRVPRSGGVGTVRVLAGNCR